MAMYERSYATLSRYNDDILTSLLERMAVTM